MLADPCADPGIFDRVVQARLPENSSDDGFCLFLSSTFTVAYQWFISKKTVILQCFRTGGSNLLQGGGAVAGVQMLILETHRTFDFQGGDADPLSPSGSEHVTI